MRRKKLAGSGYEIDKVNRSLTSACALGPFWNINFSLHFLNVHIYYRRNQLPWQVPFGALNAYPGRHVHLKLPCVFSQRWSQLAGRCRTNGLLTGVGIGTFVGCTVGRMRVGEGWMDKDEPEKWEANVNSWQTACSHGRGEVLQHADEAVGNDERVLSFLIANDFVEDLWCLGAELLS